MVTGASRADAALLVIDGAEGVQDNSRRHGTMLSLLGIVQVVVLVNKMDLVGWKQQMFDSIVDEYSSFLGRLDVHRACFIPIAARNGDNVAFRSEEAPWYEGPTVLEMLDRFKAAVAAVDAPLRLSVQDVYKFTEHGDDRRIVAGSIASGRLRVGDELTFLPSGKRTRVRSIEYFNGPARTDAVVGQAVGFTLAEQIYVSRGEIVTCASDPLPKVSTRLLASIFWLGKSPLVTNREYTIRFGGARVAMRLETVHSVMDASTLASAHRDRVELREVADCVLGLARPVACDLWSDVSGTSRFVILDDFQIRGGGIVRDVLPDRERTLRERVLLRNARWEPSAIPLEQRMARCAQRPTLILVTGSTHGDQRKALARGLEADLFHAGRLVDFLGIGNVLYGVDADLSRDAESRQEHIRRLAEIGHLMLHAGFIVIVTAAELSAQDIAAIRTSVGAEHIETVWLGGLPPEGVDASVAVRPEEDSLEALMRIKRVLEDKGIIYRAW
jgi:bifunctional enzyme CysN/CysC